MFAIINFLISNRKIILDFKQFLVANRRLLGYLFVITAICGILWFVHDSGYRDGVAATTAQFEKRIAEERKRVEAANAEAVQEAERRQAALLRIIQSRNAVINQLQLEAEKDPSANDGALSDDSVQRINKIH